MVLLPNMIRIMMYHGDGEGDRIQCGLQVPGEGEAAGVEVSGDTRACHVSKVEQKAECNKGFLSSSSTARNDGLGACPMFKLAQLSRLGQIRLGMMGWSVASSTPTTRT